MNLRHTRCSLNAWLWLPIALFGFSAMADDYYERQLERRREEDRQERDRQAWQQDEDRRIQGEQRLMELRQSEIDTMLRQARESVEESRRKRELKEKQEAQTAVEPPPTTDNNVVSDDVETSWPQTIKLIFFSHPLTAALIYFDMRRRRKSQAVTSADEPSKWSKFFIPAAVLAGAYLLPLYGWLTQRGKGLLIGVAAYLGVNGLSHVLGWYF